MTNHKLNGKHAIIGGGAKNLGGAIAKALAEAGVAGIAVHYHSDSSKAAADETASAVQAAGADAFSIQGDLTATAQVEKLFGAAEEQFGSIDIAINTTGMVIKKSFPDVTEEDYDKIFGINSKAAFFFMQEAGKRLSEGGKLCTILTSLLGAFTGHYSIYAGSKSPVEHFTRAASKEFGPRGISVTAVAPGPMDTPFFLRSGVRRRCGLSPVRGRPQQLQQERLTEVKDIVPLVLFLVSEGGGSPGRPSSPTADTRRSRAVMPRRGAQERGSAGMPSGAFGFRSTR